MLTYRQDGEKDEVIIMFNVGDNVQVIGNGLNDHDFAIGSIVKVIEVLGNGRYECYGNGYCQTIYEDQIKRA